jgi:hypothetical protein
MLKGQLLTSFVWPIMVMGALCEGNIEDIGDMSGDIWNVKRNIGKIGNMIGEIGEKEI